MSVYKSKYLISDGQERVYSILPISHLIHGGKLAYLKSDLPLLFSDYKLIPVNAFSSISTLPVKDIHNYFLLRGEQFWEQIISLIHDCIAAPNPDCSIWGIELFIEADPSILEEEVPTGIHLSEVYDEEGNYQRQKLFSEWGNDGNQPLLTSNDGTKVILRTNIGGTTPDMHEILKFNELRISNPELNIKLLNSIQLQSLMNSPTYLIQ